ncbi:hypothetical protein OQJ18_10075 [Fluoribacter dumoffii]|uniref:Uncharacterized protein n=1 Tax=Fluoribacter dumoffii TaxID=463 RepID=A0A377G6I0_9GAMM|nr:hypothetical protein [Fluoribacter dumoffii]KTC92364.1 hypothetical protein Ldum_0170 [Fluoribacter dumoffii NY 23]MCW8417556.1 hypothetical protein [Fluoribacter dumoffii]MCW8454603.1 hypothetical protein [Fluoribacter dumoffii]MCW8461321.1 hypothetical protein [Fluoribacter dumoffii]MCW8484761.1 hypothetical protein [Fluoribacter dumoffii]
MSGKGLHYWRQAWDNAGFSKDYQNADYLLKRYARQSFTSYGNEIAHFYFGESRSIFVPTINSQSRRSTPDRQRMDSVIDDLQGILNGRPIYKDGDLHNILRVFGEKTNRDYTTSFNIAEKPSFLENFIFLEFFFSFLKKCFGYDQIEEKENSFSPKN